MSKHTPTPWAHSDYAGDIADANGELLATAYPMDGGGHEEASANAAFIVKAVNSHDALVAALRDCRGFTAWQDEKIDAVLAAVEAA